MAGSGISAISPGRWSAISSEVHYGSELHLTSSSKFFLATKGNHVTSIEFNDAAMDAFNGDILQKAAASNGKFPIPRDSSVEQIAQILTAQLESVGFVTDPEAVKERAAAMHAAFRDGSL